MRDGVAEEPKNPLNGRWTLVSVIAALVLGLSSLLIFLTPRQIIDAFEGLPHPLLLDSIFFFILGCWTTVERWRACLGFRATRLVSLHTMGVAHAGNLLIPFRAGEPLRVFLLARLGVAPEFGTSALVQERLADQFFRVVFLSGTVVLMGVAGGDELGSRLLGVSLATVVMVGFVLLLVKSREAVAKQVGGWLGRLPYLEADPVEAYVLSTLTDLAASWTSPGGKKALLWGFLAWLVFALHTKYILDAFLPMNTLAMSFLILALTPATAPTQPGFFHGLALAGMMMLGADKVPALQGAVVIHMMQMVFFTTWGVISWFAIDRHLKEVFRREASEKSAKASEQSIESSVEPE